MQDLRASSIALAESSVSIGTEMPNNFTEISFYFRLKPELGVCTVYPLCIEREALTDVWISGHQFKAQWNLPLFADYRDFPLIPAGHMSEITSPVLLMAQVAQVKMSSDHFFEDGFIWARSHQIYPSYYKDLWDIMKPSMWKGVSIVSNSNTLARIMISLKIHVPGGVLTIPALRLREMDWMRI